MKFLQRINRQNKPKKRLKELLLLVSRLGLVLFLVIAFADPIFESGNNELNNLSVKLIVIDNTISLTNQHDGQSLINVSKQLSVSYAKKVGNGELIYMGNYRLNKFNTEIDYLECLNEISANKAKFRIDMGDSRTKDIAVFSDFQQEVVSQIEPLARDSVSLLLFSVESSNAQNLFVDSVYLKTPFSIGENKRSIGVRLSNGGDEDNENVLIRVLNEGRQLSSAVANVAGHNSETIYFEIENSIGTEFIIEVEDYEVAFDNQFFISIPEYEPIKVSIVGGESNDRIESVFANENYFELNVYKESTVDFEQLFTADLVIVHSMDILPHWFDKSRFEGDILVIPTSNIDINNFSELLGFGISSRSDSIVSSLRTSTLKHPFYRGVFENMDSRVTLPKVRNQYIAKGTNEVLLMADEPYMVRYNNGNMIYWFNGSLDDSSYGIINHAIFLPLLYRIAEDSRGLNQALSFLLSEEPLEILMEDGVDGLLELRGGNGQYVPESYFNQSNLVLTLPTELNTPGFYYLMSGEDTVKVIALNTDRKESILNGMTNDELKSHFREYPNVHIIESKSGDLLEADLRELNGQKSLWKYALLLALIFLVAETALHRWLK